MTVRAFIVVPGIAAASGPAMAQTSEEVMIDFAAGQDCRISMSDAENVLPQKGVTFAEANQVVGEWNLKGDASFEGDDIVLSSRICPPGNFQVDADLAEKLLVALRGNQCAATTISLRTLIKDAGLPEEPSLDIQRTWLDEGKVVAGQHDLKLGQELCAGADQ